MTKNRWQRIEALFHAALELEPGAREAYLVHQCPAEDQELQREVRAMLQNDAAGNTRISEAIGGVAEAMMEPAAPDRAGPYRLVAELGRGGMGVVYAAERDDAAFTRRVAVKFLGCGLEAPFARDRFTQERRILAGLDHPYIGRLLDGGATADGRPYLVLEYVEGRPITEWCDHRSLGLRERCLLFEKVCEAVAYAHESLVVHRDIKPSNILVTADGTPKLLDFGIAKMITPGAGMTVTLGPAMTPQYASPEQIRGEPVTTATDVFALGATLHELLTGSPAVKLVTYSPTELIRLICESEPSRPGLCCKPGRPRIPADLDNIVMKALERDPRRRYRSAAQLAEDLRRFREGRPVEARAGSTVYRAGKFVRRHWMGVAASVAVVASLATAAVISRSEAAEAQRQRAVAVGERANAVTERSRAEAERVRAEGSAREALKQRNAAEANARVATLRTAEAERRFGQVRQLARRFLFDFHDSIQNLPGALPARRMLVKTALEYLDSLVKDKPSDPQLLREVATAYERVGDLQGNPYYPNVGDEAGALDSYQKAVQIRQALPHNTPELRAEWVLARAKEGDVRDVTGAKDQAEKIYADAMADCDCGEQSADPLLDAGVKLSVRRGDLALRMSRNQPSIGHYRRAAVLLAVLRAHAPEKLSHRDTLVKLQRKIARALYLRGSYDEALAVQQAGLEEAGALVRAQPSNVLWRRTTMLLQQQMADTVVRVNGERREERSLEFLRAASETAEQILSAEPGSVQAVMDTADARVRMGTVYTQLKRHAEAQVEIERGIALAEKGRREHPESIPMLFNLVSQEATAVQLVAMAGEHKRSLELARQGLIHCEELFKRDPKNRDVLLFYSTLHLEMGKQLARAESFEDALRHLEDAGRLVDTGLARDPKDRFMRGGMADIAGARAEAHGAMGRKSADPAARRKHLEASAAEWQRAAEFGGGERGVQAVEKALAEARKSMAEIASAK